MVPGINFPIPGHQFDFKQLDLPEAVNGCCLRRSKYLISSEIFLVLVAVNTCANRFRVGVTESGPAGMQPLCYGKWLGRSEMLSEERLIDQPHFLSSHLTVVATLK